MTWLAGARVMVTGGAGFLGTRVCARLRDRGVTDLAVPRRVSHDLTRQDVAETYVAHVRPDVIVHLAAEVGGIGANQANPGRYFYANMVMGINLIEAARQCDVRRFVQVGTVCAYPKHTPVPFSEASLWDGYPEETNAPYGVAKRALAIMLDGYRRQYGSEGIYLIPVNLYGPGDNFDPATSHVIPALIRKLVTAVEEGRDRVEVWGTGAASREFLHVDDAATGIVLATERYSDPMPVNLGSGHEITVRQLVHLISDIVGFTGQIQWDATKPDGQPRRGLDISAARERFDFTASVDLTKGVQETVDWWRQHRSKSVR